MSVENKIRELLTKKQLSEEAGPTATSGPMVATKGKDTSIPSKTAGDATNPRQGSSQDATIESERDNETENPGAKEAGAVKGSNQATITQGGAGDAPNFKTVADPSSVVNQASSKGNVHQEEFDPEEDEDLDEASDEEDDEELDEESDEDDEDDEELDEMFGLDEFAPGDGGDERPGLAAQLPPHARLRQPYLQLPECAKRAFLGQVHL